MTTPTCILTGTVTRPRLVFDTNPLLPYTTRNSNSEWATNVLVGDPRRLLAQYRILRDRRLDGHTISSLQKPLLAKKRQTGSLVVFPRLAGRENTARILGPTAKWDTDGWFTITPSLAKTLTGTDLTFTDGAKQYLTQFAPEIPDWFGLNLYDYQQEAASLAASGHRLIAEPMGLGKTRIALAAAACHNPARLLVIAPPVMATGWRKEIEESQICGTGAEISLVTAKTKPDKVMLPDRGTVITTDSLLAARPQFTKTLQDWAPGVIVVDEAHRIKNGKAKRTQQVRALARHTDSPCYCLTGTPMLASPDELLPILEVTKTIRWFKNPGAFLQTYTWKTPWGARLPRKNQLPRLRQTLDAHVWVRHPQTVVANIPEMVSQSKIVDVDLGEYRKAHREVVDAIRAWAKDLGVAPTPELVDEYCSEALPHISRLRVAAGRCKIVAAKELLADWLDTHPAGEDGLFAEPLIVWAHHREVMDALIETVEDMGVKNFGVIRGGMATEDVSRMVDDFQAGRLPVLLASIHAAGVGVTLTRATVAIFVETDWTPAIVAQAQARIHRIGQTRDTLCVTLVAPGTLDETIMRILGEKSKVLTPVLGGGQDVRPEDGAAGEVPARVVLRRLVEDTLGLG